MYTLFENTDWISFSFGCYNVFLSDLHSDCFLSTSPPLFVFSPLSQRVHHSLYVHLLYSIFVLLWHINLSTHLSSTCLWFNKLSSKRVSFIRLCRSSNMFRGFSVDTWDKKKILPLLQTFKSQLTSPVKQIVFTDGCFAGWRNIRANQNRVGLRPHSHRNKNKAAVQVFVSRLTD